MLFVIRCRRTAEYAGARGGLRRAIRGADAVLVQACDAAIADEDDPVQERPHGLADVDLGRAMAGALPRLPLDGEAALYRLRTEERLHEVAIDVIAEEADGHVVALRDDRGTVETRDVQHEHMHRRPEVL